MEDDEISNDSYSGDDAESYKQRKIILTQAITSVIAALGGIEGQRYVLGDEAYGCLKDLKKFWRKFARLTARLYRGYTMKKTKTDPALINICNSYRKWDLPKDAS